MDSFFGTPSSKLPELFSSDVRFQMMWISPNFSDVLLKPQMFPAGTNSYPWVGNSCLRNPSCPTGIRSTKKTWLSLDMLPKDDENQATNNHYLGGGFKHIYFFTPTFLEMIQVDEHMFQMGCFNHQLATVYRCIISCCKKLKMWILRCLHWRGSRSPPLLCHAWIGKMPVASWTTRGNSPSLGKLTRKKVVLKAQGSPCTGFCFYFRKNVAGPLLWSIF